MRLGLLAWWGVAMMGVVGGAALPARRSVAPLLNTRSQDVPDIPALSNVTDTTLKEASEKKKSTKDTDVDDPLNKDENIHSEELLEKYGYLECVPPGSEANTHLHRLLLYRRRQLVSSGHDTLDVRIVSPNRRLLMTDLRLNGMNKKSEGGKNTLSQIKTPDEHKLRGQSSEESIASVFWKSKENFIKTVNSKRRTVTVWDPFTGCLHHLPVCSHDDIERAVKKFQEVYHVGKGGTLDSPTVGLLARPRCGNPDNVMEEPEVNHDWQASGASRSRRGALPHHGTSYNNRGVGNLTVPEVANSSHETDKDWTDEVPDQEMMWRVAEELRKATQARHPKADSHLEWEPLPNEALKRRKRWLEEMKERYSSGKEDMRLASLMSSPAVAIASNSSHHHRDKRSLYSHLGRPFTTNLIKWRLVTAGYSSQLDVGVQRASLALAFRMWSEVIPLIFLEHSASTAVDISIGFGKRSHLGCVTEFDGLGGELGHTLRPAQDVQIHMDDDEHFTLNSDHGTSLLKVAVHEIGHVLGLEHVVRQDSVMHAVYERVLPNQGFELGQEDRKLIQNIYGPCTGFFDTVFDLLRWRADGSLTYNTFFFRKAHFWMYENRYNRTRFGDPLEVWPEWGGLPDNLDGYAHVFTLTKDIHLVFKGEQYYVYDPLKKSVAPGFPRRIAQDFHGPPTPKKPKGRIIPSNIDTVYFDKRDENLYFFKGKKVYGYDVSKGSQGCCLPGYPRRITEEFPSVGPPSSRLPRALDAAYYSYTDQKLYFLKDKYFWEVATFHPHDKQRNNSVVGPFYVHDKWYDICDTTVDPYNAYTSS